MITRFCMLNLSKEFWQFKIKINFLFDNLLITILWSYYYYSFKKSIFHKIKKAFMEEGGHKSGRGLIVILGRLVCHISLTNTHFPFSSLSFILHFITSLSSTLSDLYFSFLIPFDTLFLLILLMFDIFFIYHNVLMGNPQVHDLWGSSTHCISYM